MQNSDAWCVVTKEYNTYSYSGIVDGERHYFDSEIKAIEFRHAYCANNRSDFTHAIAPIKPGDDLYPDIEPICIN